MPTFKQNKKGMDFMENIDKEGMYKNIINIIKGTVIAIIITLIGLLIFATVLTYTDVGEETIKPVIIVITAISILIGSGISTRKIKKMGLVNGGIVGLIYILLIYITSSITGSGFALNMYSAMMLGASVIAGILGGIIGVNMKK